MWGKICPLERSDLIVVEEIMSPNLEPHGGISIFIFRRKPQKPSSVCTLQSTTVSCLPY